MINLLPYKDKVFIKKEYLGRFFAVIGIFFAGVVFISIIFLTPTFFLLNGYKNDLNYRVALSSKQAEVIDTDNMMSEIKKLNSKIGILKNKEEKLSLSLILGKIIWMKTKEVKISVLNYEGTKRVEKSKISLSGVASERQALLSFIDSLKKEFGQENVLSPVSNLLNEKNVSFSLTVLNIE